MDILLLDALVPEAIAWLEARHSVQYQPELADDLVALRQAGYKTQAIVFPRQTIVTRALLDFLPKLKALSRLHVSSDLLNDGSQLRTRHQARPRKLRPTPLGTLRGGPTSSRPSGRVSNSKPALTAAQRLRPVT